MGRIFGCRFIETTEAKVFKGEDLTSAFRNLTVKTALSSASKTVSVSEAFSAEDAEKLVGRKLLIGQNTYTVTAASNTAQTITVDENIAVADAIANAKIYPGEAGKEGMDVYSTLFIGADAYGVSEVEGGGLKTIIKQLGSAGSGDPLDQRATVGWKAVKTAAILSEPFMVRVETASTLKD
ncbi:MAG: N4-gp56 family major capsid protein [Oscillospiraceae bacterium]|nr:N4-gp56 family major capsid protein [Oscillospiraceae bacterium]